MLTLLSLTSGLFMHMATTVFCQPIVAGRYLYHVNLLPYNVGGDLRLQTRRLCGGRAPSLISHSHLGNHSNDYYWLRTMLDIRMQLAVAYDKLDGYDVLFLESLCRPCRAGAFCPFEPRRWVGCERFLSIKFNHKKRFHVKSTSSSLSRKWF